MNERRLDVLVMLLSTDWFLPYWSRLGIGMDNAKRIAIQEGCREIVKQIMHEVREYWQRNFSKERAEKTRSMLEALLKKCQADRQTIDRIAALTKDDEPSEIDEGTGWLLLIITEKLLKDSLRDVPQLDTAIKEAVAKVWRTVNSPATPDVDLQSLSLSSKSEWDVFIRTATPDLPTMLSDNLSAVAGKDKFERFWAAINANLSAEQKRALVDWYRTVAESMTGEALRLPQEA